MNAQPVLSPRRHHIALVTPGIQSLAWLKRTLHDLTSANPARQVTVVAPSPYMVSILRQQLVGAGCANLVFSVQLRPIAERIARASRSGALDRPLTGPLEAAAIRAAVRQAAGPVLEPLAAHRALQDSLGALFRELGHAEAPEQALAAIAAGNSVGAAASRTYAAYSALTHRYADLPRQLRIAARLALDGAAPADLGAIVLYLPASLDASERQLVEAVGRHTPVAAAFARVDDPQADRPMRAVAQRLAAALDTELIEEHQSPELPPVRVLSAPDPEEEARAVVRRVLAEMEARVPLWGIQVLYAADDPYAALVRETLDSAGVPWHSALGRPAAAGAAARSLLGLLALRERGFAREAVLDWIAARPAIPASVKDPLPEVPISAWDRLSRRAQVLEGAQQWIARFERLIQTLEFEQQQRHDWHAEAHGHETSDHAPRPAHDIEYARAIVAAIRKLDADTRPPSEPATWGALVDWAAALRHAYVRENPTWPDSERLVSEALDAALDSLRGAAALEPTTTISVFRDSLAAALEARRLEEGEAGVGVLVGPLGSTIGASFERTFLVGMAEALLPARPPADPLTPAGDPLGQRERQRSGERRAFLAALSSAGSTGCIVLSDSRTDGAARASHPSRWLLEQVARMQGGPAVYASDLPRLFGPERPWLERIASAYDALLRCTTPLNVADLRLREVVASHAVGQDVYASPLARRHDLALGRALRVARARHSRQFTEFDGNLAAVAPDSLRIGRPFSNQSGASSATSLERWAGCPFQYFLVNVLRVESTERPDEEWTINALDKGTLVHAALEDFFRERFEQGRSTADEPFGTADHALLDDIANRLLDDLQAQGRAGHPVAWENARAALVRDLHMQLEREEAWRQQQRLAPVLFEHTFGDERDPLTWPAVEVPLADGSVVRFRGAIDRLDLSPPGEEPARALVIDYKSGGTWGFDGLDMDPVLAGRHVQLALYARAARANAAAHATEVRAEYRFVSSKGKFERRQIVADERADERLLEVVQHAADGIRAGAFLPMPGAADRGSFINCRFCDYDRICSTARDEEWQRKAPNAAFVPLVDPR